ncbi:MAG: ubiquinone/menaquinone biosynthesis methyltransferase [Actinomycetota bacterium]|nr:ubiquinone/menaquinone biosynthesis methyltransferase [Actinomycetota bacterium]
MFDGIVERYDIVNDALSLGFDRYWRSATARAVHAKPGELVLDLGVGTGRLPASLPAGVRCVGVDLSSAMLQRARRRAGPSISLVQGSAFRLPFRNGCFDRAVSAFVLRNLSDLGTAFAELAHVVRPGGSIAVVDITAPRNPVFRALFEGYFAAAAPLLGRMVGRSDAYRYLVRSVARLPPAGDVCRMLTQAGFEPCRSRPLTGGVTTLWTATRS